MPSDDSQTRRSLQLIADALGVSVASFYEDARPGLATEAEDRALQHLSRDSAELLQSFMTIENPKSRQLCIAFVQKVAAGKVDTDS